MVYPDVYCAICGGPVVEVEIFTEPKSKSYKAYLARCRAKDPSYGYEERKNTYNGNIITREETRWTATVMVLGFNPDSKAAVNGAFLATIGIFDGFAGVTVHDTFDPYFNLGELGEGPHLEDSFPCYKKLGKESDFEPVFPFHMSCYYVLRRRVGCRIGPLPVGLPLDMDKDILFGVMRTLANTNMLNIDYGSPNPKSEYGSWRANTGEEIFAADPGRVIGLEDQIRGKMKAGFFAPSRGAEFDLSDNVQHDPFQGLPFDIFLKIAEQCEDPTHLLRWAKASWFANIALRNANEAFWTMLIRTQMGWFFELLPCLDDSELCRGSSMRAIFLWASCRLEPRLGMKDGTVLRIANRRRIWTAPCAELADQFCSKLPPRRGAASIENIPLNFREVLLSKATWSRRYIVTHNKETRLYSKVQKCFWIDEWEDTYEKMQVVEAFFMRSNGFLTGIALTIEDGERRMVGSINDDPIKFEVVIPVEDWISGMVVHIPDIQFVRGLVGSIRETLPKGITIICKSGRELHLGETNQGYPIRALVARPGDQVVGLVTETAADKPIGTFTRLGLITLCNEELGDRRILPDNIVRRRHSRIDEIMWKDDGSRFFGTPYWNNPSVRILHRDDVRELGRLHNTGLSEVHGQLLSQEALVWAKDMTELRRLKSVSIFTTYSHMEDISGEDVDPYRICGLGVDFSAEHTESRRVVGVEGNPEVDDREAGPTTLNGPRISDCSGAKLGGMKGNGDFRIELDIDGLGGEIITEIFHGQNKYRPINCLRFRTNRGREVGCSAALNGCYSGSDAPEWLSIKAPLNRTIVGIIVTFAHGDGGGGSEGPNAYKELVSIAALSMPLGIEGEIIESDDEDYEFREEDDDEESDEDDEEADDETSNED